MISRKNLPATANRRMAFILKATVALAIAFVLTNGTPAQAQSCRTKTNLPIQNLVDFQNSTVTNLGNNNFRIHFAIVSDPSITLICADSGQTPSCGFDGAYFRSDLSGNIIAESGFGSCNLKSTITTTGATSVVIAYEIRFELNGNPSKQTFGPACMTTDPNVIGVNQTVSLAQLLC